MLSQDGVCIFGNKINFSFKIEIAGKSAKESCCRVHAAIVNQDCTNSKSI